MTNKWLKDPKIQATLIVGLLTLLFGMMIRGKGGSFIDLWLMKAFHSAPVTVKEIFLRITRLGDVIAYVIILVPLLLYLLYKKEYRLVLILLLASLGSDMINRIIKLMFIRVRPTDFFYIAQGGYSFPSGHAMTSASFYITAGQLFKRKVPQWKPIGNFFIILPLFISMSRLVVGVHWPSDVLLGYMIGRVLSMWWIAIDQKLAQKSFGIKQKSC